MKFQFAVTVIYGIIITNSNIFVSDKMIPINNKKSIDAKHQRATPKEFDPDLHLNT
jgi:hypothetical protein